MLEHSKTAVAGGHSAIRSVCAEKSQYAVLTVENLG